MFAEYLKSKKKTIRLFLLFAVAFCVTFYLYRLPLGAVIYPVIICVVIGGIALAADYAKMREKHEELQRICHMTVEMIGDLPETSDVCEKDYQQLIQTIKRETIDEKARASASYLDMVDYYTIWAHQIKTPISAMKLLLENEDSDTARQLRLELHHIQQYVEMVLTFLRLESDQSDYVFKECDVDELIKASVRKLAPEFIGRKLSLDYEPVQMKLVTDEKWFSFVLEQILTNALKYTKEGGIHIYSNNENCICIEDTGIGIAKQDLPRIFEKGFTGYNGRIDKEASGLGLYLCKRICGKLGLKIRISSKVGQGTNVSVGTCLIDT